MEVKINATRMELLKLKNRLKMAIRGHKLLKDKRDELVREFLKLVRENKRLREEVDSRMGEVYRRLFVSRAAMGGEAWESALSSSQASLEVEVATEHTMNVRMPRLSLKTSGDIRPYGLAFTSGEMDLALEDMQKLVERVARLAEVERRVALLADEIEKTRRRVNALEYVLIPQIQETVRRISMRLAEIERSNASRLMRIKEIVRAH